jgi:hypothetical protein
MERMNPEQLEKLVHTALRSLPNRRAPATLEARVRAAIEAQAAIPWWHKSYAYWPAPVRVAFLVLCAGLAGLLVFAGISLQTGFDSAQLSGTFAPVLDWGGRIVALVRGVADFIALVGRNIPTLWLYGGVAFVAGLYAMLFGLGATAYRTLWAHR